MGRDLPHGGVVGAFIGDWVVAKRATLGAVVEIVVVDVRCTTGIAGMVIEPVVTESQTFR